MKKVTALIITMLLCFSILTGQGVIPVQAANTKTTEEQKEKVILATGIMKSNASGGINQKQKVTRAKFAYNLVQASSYKDTVAKKINTSLFTDVRSSYWAAPYIKIAIEQGWLSGNLQGKFRPTTAVTLKEAVNGIVTLLGYEDSDFKGDKTSAKMSFYYSNKLNQGISKTQNQSLNNGDVIQLLYNTLVAKTKDGKVYGETLGYPLNEDGDIDYLKLIDDKMKGPIVATTKWTSQISFSASNATIYRNNKKASYKSIKADDVLYYSKELKTIWAYRNQVTGTYTAATPDRINPESVTVAGTEYKIETQDATYALSTMGDFEYGDKVTLLLGKDNTIVGVRTASNTSTVIGGIVIEKGKHENSSDDENATVKTYIRIVDSTGVEHQYDYDTSKISVGDPVQISFIDEKVVVNKVDLYDISGKVSEDGEKLGNKKFAEDVNILDYRTGRYKPIAVKDLEGLTLYTNEIMYYRLNADGEITDLIVRDLTGELYEYGILLSAAESGTAFDAVGTYTYEINGETGAATTKFKMMVDKETGPARF